MIAPSILGLCQSVADAGGRALLVGGWVRDYLLGRERSDYDLEVYRLEAEPLRALLARHGPVNSVGEAYTVYKVRLPARGEFPSLVVDVSLPRRESKIGRGHRAFLVTGDPSMSYQEAARRRDLTINALMLDPLTGELLDPYHGQEDLAAQRLRVVDAATFVEDSLRVLRLVQFAARLSFAIEPATVALCRTIDLSDLPAERIWGEVEKWLLQAKTPSIGLWAASDLGVLDRLWPELLPHHDADELTRLGAALDAGRAQIDELPYPKRVAVMLALLCRSLADPGAFLESLRLQRLGQYDVRRQILALHAHCGLPARWHQEEEAGRLISNGQFRRLALAVEPGLLARVESASLAPTDVLAWFRARIAALDLEVAAPTPLLLGRHLLALGVEPGPRVGQLTRLVYEMQLDDQVTTLDEAIDAARKLLSPS
jgi:tRNA nucleotidyltransferase (CCA-adding enzyme)